MRAAAARDPDLGLGRVAIRGWSFGGYLAALAGRPHTVLPLPGVTHMTPQEEITENLLLLQAEFLERALGAEAPK